MRKKHRWHYVSGGDLPKESGRYFVAIKLNNGEIITDTHEYDDSGFSKYSNIYAWCELPTPPEVK